MTLRFASLLMILAGLGAPCVAQTTARGIVFDDANGNGARDAGEPGVAGVCVSNGCEAVRTDSGGAWSLAVSDDTILFVVKPTGWMNPLGDYRLPRFYYLHKPNGSPPLATPGVAPTGPLPESVDFPLRRQEEPDRFRAVCFADPQARGLREVNFITHDVVEELIGMDAAFGVTLGDIVADDPELFGAISAITGQIGIPWYYVMGNHDHNRGATNDAESDETFERYFGPTTYAFEYGKAVFIALDNVFVIPGGDETRLTDAQLQFVREYLAGVPMDRLVVFMMHIPIVATKNREDLFRLIENRPHTFSISGHTHEQAHLFLDEKAGWRGVEPHHHFINATVSGSWWCGLMDETGIPHATMNDGGPNGYSIIEFDGAQYRIRFKAARRPADYQMNIYVPAEAALGELESVEVLVNVFAGSDRSKVEMRLGDTGSWAPLEQTRAIDPQCLRMYEQNEHLNEEVFGWKMDYPSKTSHMWKGTLPPVAEPGAYTLTVRATDMFGQTDTAHRIIRIY